MHFFIFGLEYDIRIQIRMEPKVPQILLLCLSIKFFYGQQCGVNPFFNVSISANPIKVTKWNK
jgi:hypothetical protein